MPSRDNIGTTVANSLCVSCEACIAVCPAAAISSSVRDGQLLPIVDDELCTDCGRCLTVCPGLDVSHGGALTGDDLCSAVLGSVRGAYEVQANDAAYLDTTTSGGFVTRLLVALLEEGYAGAFVLGDDAGAGDVPRLDLARSGADVMRGAGSKYVPASMANVFTTLEADRTGRYVVVGTPCQLASLRAFLAQKRLDRDRLLLVGLFCDRTMNLNFARYLESVYRRGDEALVRCEHRSKRRRGWPGDLELTFASGRIVSVGRDVRMDVKSYFGLQRCLLCADKFNVAADLSVGDCYVPGRSDVRGVSNVLVMTEAGEAVFERHRRLFSTAATDAATVLASQRIGDRAENLRRAREMGEAIHRDLTGGAPVDGAVCDSRAFESERMKLAWGRVPRVGRIRIAARLARTGKQVDRMANRAAVALTVAYATARVVLTKRGSSPDRPGSKVLMIGATFDNKGAQGMIFTVMDEIARRCPEAEFVVLAANEMTSRVLDKYKLEVVPWTVGLKAPLAGGPGVWVDDSQPRPESARRRLDEVIADASCVVDISGYRLGSEWGIGNTLDYLLNLLIARILGIPYYVLPQSLGPFDYPGMRRLIVAPVLRTALRSARLVFAREDQGFEATSRFTNVNLVRTGDIVLGSNEDKAANVYRDGFGPRAVDISPGTVGIVPSARVFDRMGDKAEELYASVLRLLVERRRRVCFVAHSAEDAELCERLAHRYLEGDDVAVLGADMDAIELEGLLGSLEFIVASRFHSVVHAYRRGIPAVIVGWATKYGELAELFGQSDYVFDVRDGVDVARVIGAVEKMLDAAPAESAEVRRGGVGRDNRATFDRLSACMSAKSRAPRRSPAWREYLALAVLALVVVVLAVDVVTIRRDWLFTPPKFAGDDFMQIAGSRKSANAVNIVIGLAVREASGDEPPALLVMPTDLDSLRAPVPGWKGVMSQALSHGTVKQLTAGHISKRGYDPRLSGEQIAALLAANTVRRYPQNVVAIAVSGQTDRGGEFALFTDSARRTIYILPLGFFDAGVAR